MSGWIGVDLDGTLAEYHGWCDGAIGKPVDKMMQRVKAWVADGREVRIFTARAATPELVPQVEEWLAEHGIAGLAVTNVKDFGMIELWDDRCVQVIPNTGMRATEEQFLRGTAP